MEDRPTLRVRKKQATRQRIADTAARLFADLGYDAVSISDVARAAEVSDQTVYNYFATKPELVLDRAEEYRRMYVRAIADRERSSTPAEALRPIVHADIDRFVNTDPRLARGEFPALGRNSGPLRRFTLEMREGQVTAISSAIGSTTSNLHPLICTAHASALIAVVQHVTDRIGDATLRGSDPHQEARSLRADVDAALRSLDRQFRASLEHSPDEPHRS